MSSLSSTQKRCLLFGVSLLSFTGFLDATIVSTALPDIQTTLHIPIAELQWVMNAFFLGVSAFMASMGRIADLYGRRKIFYMGTIIFMLASIGAGLAATPVFLIVCRALQGITTAITIPVGVALIQVAYDQKDLAKAMGIFGSITGAGLALGPIMGGALVTAFGWPAIFFVNIPFVILGFVLCLLSVKESRSQSNMTLDYLGILFLTITITSLVLSMITLSVTSLVVFLVSLLIFIFVERRVKHPIMAGYLFKNSVFVPSLLFSIAAGAAVSVLLFIDPLYLHQVLEKSNFATGALLFIISSMVVIGAYISGHLYRYFGGRLLMIFGSIAFLLMALLHTVFGTSTNYGLIVPAFILMGLGWAIVNTTPATLLGERIQGDHMGVAIGALFSFFNISASVVLALATLLFHTQSSFMSGMHVMYVPILVLASVSLFVLIFIMKKP